MESLNSLQLEITYEVLGWIAFFSWTICFYPQVIFNYRRKSVVGFNFNFAVLNLTKHSSYLIYNATLYFSKDVQTQYYEKYGFGQILADENIPSNALQKQNAINLFPCFNSWELGIDVGVVHQMIPVAANDVAFSIHAVLITAFILFQIAIYERGDQKVSKITIAIVSAAWLSAAVCFLIALPSHSWLWLIFVFNKMQVIMAVIKYIPQVYMNFARKSTVGFSIGYILFDFCGGTTNLAQMTMQSIDQGSWVNFSGNIGKILLSLVSIFFDLIFMCQHYMLYPATRVVISPKLEGESVEPLIKSPDYPESANV